MLNLLVSLKGAEATAPFLFVTPKLVIPAQSFVQSVGVLIPKSLRDAVCARGGRICRARVPHQARSSGRAGEE